MKNKLLAIIFLLGAILVAKAYAATLVTSDGTMLGLKHVYVTSKCAAGSTVAVTGALTGGSAKKAMVHKFTVAGAELDVLVRIQHTAHGVYIDLVGDATITSLSTTVLGMSLTTPNHPTPAKDTHDTAALVAAGGS